MSISRKTSISNGVDKSSKLVRKTVNFEDIMSVGGHI